MAGVKRDADQAVLGPRIFMMNQGQSGRWEHVGSIPRDDIKIVTR
jgi:hypothetical protein